MLAMEETPLFEYIGVGLRLTVWPTALVVEDALREMWLALADIAQVVRVPWDSAFTVHTVDGRSYTYRLPPGPLEAALHSFPQSRAALAPCYPGWIYDIG
jgi:hypothetical protein